MDEAEIKINPIEISKSNEKVFDKVEKLQKCQRQGSNEISVDDTENIMDQNEGTSKNKLQVRMNFLIIKQSAKYLKSC